MIPGMPASELKVWAREEIMDAIDAMIADKKHEGGRVIDLEDELALQKERDRVAKFLNRPTKY
jgi:hypothetical protein